ncbi:hypothetical protein HU200_064390 [Digitaria exilis]|uniref:Legume lectin domain-containing protein n=1 Tax=Digitaria exilis TaxID=1010633 RepID=A0A835DYR3_9POAL|nr:hypothetical protein HU200_064390 [Digitaria exilis]
MSPAPNVRTTSSAAGPSAIELPCGSKILGARMAVTECFLSISDYASELNYSNNSISDYASELNYSNDSHWVKPVVELTKDQRYQGITGSVGRVWYTRQVPLWDRATRQLASFNTTFSFPIKFGGDSRAPSEGMAFFLSYYPSVTPANSAGGTLGLFRNATVSDDERSSSTPTPTETGIIASATLASTSTTSSPWRTRTRTSLAGTSPPGIPRQEAVAVGFSASTGDFFELHELMSCHSTLICRSWPRHLRGLL